MKPESRPYSFLLVEVCARVYCRSDCSGVWGLSVQHRLIRHRIESVDTRPRLIRYRIDSIDTVSTHSIPYRLVRHRIELVDTRPRLIRYRISPNAQGLVERKGLPGMPNGFPLVRVCVLHSWMAWDVLPSEPPPLPSGQGSRGRHQVRSRQWAWSQGAGNRPPRPPSLGVTGGCALGGQQLIIG